MQSLPNPSRELTLLAAIGIAGDKRLGHLAEQTAYSSFDWPRFLMLCAEHSMGAMAGARLSTVAPGIMPELVVAPLRTALRESGALALAQTAEAVAVQTALREAGIGSIVLRGVALAHLLHPGHPEWRRSSDIDLLVDLPDHAAADQILRETGCRRNWPKVELPGGDVAAIMRTGRLFTYSTPGTRQTIELHHPLSLEQQGVPSDFAALFDASREIDTPLGTLRGLDGPLHAAFLASHAIACGGRRLRWYCDIARAMTRIRSRSCVDAVVTSTLPVSLATLSVVDCVIASLYAAVGASWNAPSDSPGWSGARRICHDMDHASGTRTAAA